MAQRQATVAQRLTARPGATWQIHWASHGLALGAWQEVRLSAADEELRFTVRCGEEKEELRAELFIIYLLAIHIITYNKD